jgi:hypothetical protein
MVTELKETNIQLYRHNVIQLVLNQVPLREWYGSIDNDKLTGKEISCLLNFHPQLIDIYIPYLSKLDSFYLRVVLTHQPNLVTYLEPYLYKITSSDITALLTKQPKLATNLIPHFENLRDIDGLIPLIVKHREFIKLFTFNRIIFNGEMIVKILIDYPDMIPYFKNRFKFKKIDKVDIINLLVHQPTLVSDCKPYLKDMTANNLSYLLRRQPLLIDALSDFVGILSKSDIKSITFFHPQLKSYLLK